MRPLAEERKRIQAEHEKVKGLALRGLEALRAAQSYRRGAATPNRFARECLVEAKALLAEIEVLTKEGG